MSQIKTISIFLAVVGLILPLWIERGFSFVVREHVNNIIAVDVLQYHAVKTQYQKYTFVVIML